MNINTNMERQDAAVKKMAKYLREGARMLDLACPECNNPIFQLKTGEKACVICERPVLLENEVLASTDQGEDAPVEQSASEELIGEAVPDLSVPTHDLSNSQFMTCSNLKQACLLKLAALTKRILTSEDENAASLVLTNILKVLEILDKLKLI